MSPASDALAGDHEPLSTVEPSTAEPPTVDRLLDAAAALFWEKGYAPTTTREIAARVGIQQASLYHHMASKEDLLYQICIASLKQFITDVQAATAAVDDPRERIRTLIHSHLTTLLKHQQRNVTMLTEMRSLGPAHRAEVVALRESYASFMRSTFEAGQADGVIRTDIPAKYLVLALLNILNWAALWFRPNRALSAAQLVDLFLTIYLDGAAIAKRPAPLPDFEAAGPRKTATRARKPSKPSGNPTFDRVVEAAVALFSRKGYTATSTREVAALLGIQKASLYYHVDSKEDLLYAICKKSLERIRADVEAAVSAVEDPLERVRALIGAHVESMLRDEIEHSTTLAEMHALSEQRLVQVLSLRDAYEDLVRSVLQQGQDAGVLRADIDVKYLRLSLLGLMNRVLVWYGRGGPLTPQQIGPLLAAIYLNGAAGTAAHS